MRKRWSTEDEQYLIDNYGQLTIQCIANEFNVSYQAIVDKCRKIGLNKKMLSGEYWHPDEDKVLEDHFTWAPKNHLMQLLPNRTWSAIYQRGSKTLGHSRETQDKYNINYRFFENFTQESAYILGFIAADGHLKIDHGERHETKLQFELASYDRDILEKIKDTISFEGPIALSNRDTVKLQINNRKVCLDLEIIGIPRNNKTQDVGWPQTLPDSLAHHFTRGLFDGDGSIYQDNGAYVIQLLGNEHMLDTLKEKLPIQSIRKVRKRSYANIWDLKFSHKMAVQIIHWLYQDATIYLDRKYQKAIELLNK